MSYKKGKYMIIKNDTPFPDNSPRGMGNLDYISDKFATEHLGHCDHTECKFCRDSICCYGMRDVGCVIIEPESLKRVDDHISSFLISANKAFYDRGILDKGVPQSIKEIERWIIDMIKHPIL